MLDTSMEVIEARATRSASTASLPYVGSGGCWLAGSSVKLPSRCKQYFTFVVSLPAAPAPSMEPWKRHTKNLHAHSTATVGLPHKKCVATYLVRMGRDV
jgi:hypothetical protein